ncbi:PiggyBac transposable element-derived protein 3 [Elysia marginata]|uniref:PiggyBac transposable element-derived protein 3 n=1 Tax=Elysia marginata TaxID=1093978 RepID=A0AAV4G4Z5_9GAST|nr:PiggyBac transposable element-derived protein 3 [Elysia marginata]
MGGTDRMDQNIANCRVNIRVKKWWWPLFVFCLNTSSHNAWCLYRKSAAAKQRSLDYLGFLRHIALSHMYTNTGGGWSSTDQVQWRYQSLVKLQVTRVDTT